MISRLRGTVLSRGLDRIELETKGGVVYEVEVPASALQRLPAVGFEVEIRIVHVVTETSAALYGFLDSNERALFQRLLTASGVGAKVALAMMSTFTAERLARALVEKDHAALRQVSGIGKKKAEKIALELADKVADLAFVSPVDQRDAGGARDAVQALIALGYSFGEADRAVRDALETGGIEGTEELIRRALAS